VARLAGEFVCVRMQSMNGVNINLFQFEYDLTFMAFFMDSNDRFYARYGGREDFDAEAGLTKDSLVRVMEQVLELHQAGKVQTGRYEPSGKPARTPEDIPSMNAMIAKRQDSKCIHCHDVKVAELKHLQSLGKFSREMVFTYPMPSAVGLEMDSREQNRVRRVASGSIAARAGLRVDDVIVAADGHRVLTQADMSRVLELTPKEASLPLEIHRGGKSVRSTLELAGDWRRGREPAWRESLHVAGPNGGFWGQKLSADERSKYGLAADTMAVKVTFIWGDHTRQAGLKNGDVVVSLDGQHHDWRINQLHAHLNLHRDYGDTVPLVVLRDGKEQALSMKLPGGPDPLE
jgi:predicted metalloprotease with PDZ domain